eukprot:CAMPEP_0174735766 /NCGR_PEP_ID=MMETSP1094-20130205/65525_1 /TAXON_ID=156173 /ORGANISM="Chrysochromulina brevifilum, Strain UTEX LB 985" /LENGTH=90 /DNA_ID=CAMNT_0015938765 /DNA_START=315 /DNA_END=588 /DNA_ORIENTATION=-
MRSPHSSTSPVPACSDMPVQYLVKPMDVASDEDDGEEAMLPPRQPYWRAGDERLGSGEQHKASRGVLPGKWTEVACVLIPILKYRGHIHV